MLQTEKYTFRASDLPPDIGAKIAFLRRGLGWSQSELAKRSKLGRGTIVRIEPHDGHRPGTVARGGRTPRTETVIQILRALAAGGAEIELQELVPALPETDVTHVIGYGPLSRVRRCELGFSLKYVADRIGTTEATLSRFERNVGPAPTFCKVEVTAIGDHMPYLTNKRLAKALKFESIAEHEAWCDRRERA